jgi:hypothetical protein
MKVGDDVLYETAPDRGGFRKIMSGRISWLDPRDGLALIVPNALYAYHPSAPDLGRYLPPPKQEPCLQEALQPLPEGLLRDLVLARYQPTNGRHDGSDSV